MSRGPRIRSGAHGDECLRVGMFLVHQPVHSLRIRWCTLGCVAILPFGPNAMRRSSVARRPERQVT